MRILTLALLSCLAAAYADDPLQQARELMAKKSYPEAEAVLREAAKTPALAADADYLWYECLRERGELDRALDKLRQAAELADDRADWNLELGRGLASLGKHDEAILCYFRALTSQPDLSAAHSALAEALLARGMGTEAEAQYREALRIAPDSEADWLALCQMLLAEGRLMPALQAAQSGLERRPNSIPLLRALARVYERDGETTRALETCLNLVRMVPRDAGLQLDLGRLYRAKREPDKALAAYRKAVQLAPRGSAGYTGQAWVLADRPGRAGAALALADAALRISHGDSEATTARAWALHKLGRHGDASEILKAIVAKEPGNATALYCLGMVAKALGSMEEAQKWLRQAVAEGAGTDVSRRAQGALTELTTPVPPAAGTAPAITPSAP